MNLSTILKFTPETNPMTDAGDIIYGGTGGTPTRLAKGTDGQVLTLASGNPSWADASGGGTTAVSIIPTASFYSQYNGSTRSLASNEHYFGLIYIPSSISINKVSFSITNYSGTGTADIGLYSEDGQTKLFEFETDSISSNGVKTKTLSAQQDISAGWYYLAATLNNGTFEFKSLMINAPFSDLYSKSTYPVFSGKITGVTAGTLPATFDPTALTATGNSTILVRFDN